MADVDPNRATLQPFVDDDNVRGNETPQVLKTRQRLGSIAGMIQPGGANDGEVNLLAPDVVATAQAILTGTPGEWILGWRFGFIQLKFITTDWAHYRGATPADGSVFVALDRPPSRPQQLCRDTWLPDEAPYPGGVTPLFYDPDIWIGVTNPIRGTKQIVYPWSMPDTGELSVRASFSDSPARTWPLREKNTKFAPARDNFLYSCQTEAVFMCTFVAQEPPDGRVIALKHFRWNALWRAHFRRNAAGVIQIRDQNCTANIEPVVHTGEPSSDSRYRGRNTDRTLPVCSTVLVNATLDPASKQYDSGWKDWVVGHPA